MELEEMWKFVWCIFVLQMTRVLGFEGEWSIPLEHAFGGNGDESSFQPRGEIRLVQSRPGGPISGRYIQESVLSLGNKRELLKTAADKGFYRLRCPAYFGDGKISTENFVLSFTEACRVVKSELSEVLTLSVDSSKQKILSITTQPYTAESSGDWSCDGESVNRDSELYPYDVFNTTIRITELVEGPAPEAQAYIQRREREEEERKRGEQTGDNRSFFAKYWMYIVPVIIFVMLSGAMNPEGQTQGR